eukprot:gene46584-58085_t
MFPVHYHLKYAGLLPPLDLYREGMVIDSQIGEGHSLVNIGLRQEAVIDYELKACTRVTVKLLDLDNKTTTSNSNTYIQGDAVAPTNPRADH